MTRTRKITWTAITFLSIALIQPTGAALTTVADNYEGSYAHGYDNIIGNTSNFEINSIDACLRGKTLIVSIFTTLHGKGDNHLFDSLTDSKGVGYGDLFPGSSWTS